MPLYELQKGHSLQLSQLLTLFSSTLLMNTVDRVLMLKRQQTNHEGRLTHNINFTEASYDIYMEQASKQPGLCAFRPNTYVSVACPLPTFPIEVS